ncbi:MAG: orc1/cdc6 family replication initiation protein [Prevotella sp.]|nr:orc1/cdc6 family replication initiation protein [Prevotella sp.]
MNTPFQYGTLATRENFVDRVEDRAQLKNFLSSHINVMLVSPRRWGKSSLVKVAMEELQDEDKDVRVCYIDAFSIGSEAEFYRTFASQVIACASSKLEKRIQDAKKFLTGVVPQVVIKDDVTNFMAFDVKFVPQEQDKMDILRLPETLAHAKKIKIIVCIDEFQQLANLPEYKNMEGKMRSAWQQQERVSYCLYGSKRHMMLDIFNNSNSPFYRFGQLLFLNKIPKEEWMPFIVDTFKKSGKRISDEFASRICDLTECHSWYLQQCCYFVWNATVTEVSEQSFSYGLKQMINTNSPMFLNDTETLAASQIEMLRAIKDGVLQLSSTETRTKYHLGNPNTISKNKKVLQNKDIVEVKGGKMVFVDPIYRLWFEREYG